MRRREIIGLLGGAAAWPLAARAQQTARPLQVGYLYPGPQAAADIRMGAILTGLRAGGLRVPDQVVMIPRVTGGDIASLSSMAADLAARKVDLIIALSPPAIHAAHAATTTIPIVAGDLESDPIAAGFIASNAKPGGNISGTFLDFPEFSKKWLEALMEAVPQLTTVAVFWDPATGPTQLAGVKEAAKLFGLELVLIEMRGLDDIEPAFRSASERRAGAVLILSSPVVGARTKLFAKLADTHRLPAITLFTDFARDGGLMAYGPNLPAFFRQQGVIAARILRGAKVAEMPIEAPTKFEFVLNLKAASRLGLSIPPSLLLRADEVIE